MGKTQATGFAAEDFACRYLQQAGLKLILKNFSCRVGEIDLIMRDATTLVFVEVRFRKSKLFGSSIESVTRIKQKKIMKAAYFYLQTNKINEKMACRFDVIGITSIGAAPEVEWVKNAFEV